VRGNWCADAGFVEGAFHRRTGLAIAFLDATHQFVLFASDELKIVIRECRPLLFDFASEDIPVRFAFEFVHRCFLFFIFSFSTSSFAEKLVCQFELQLIPSRGWAAVH
jgi:hypothetical protein